MNFPISTKSDRQTKTVMLVEGVSEARDRHSRTLARRSYDVTTADSLEQARTLWQPKQFHLIIVSLVSLGDAAAAFCDQIKERDADQLIAIIFHPDQELPPTTCATIIFTTEPDEYFLARVETLTAATYAA